MHLPAFLLSVFVCLPAAVCLSVCLVSTFNFPASLPVLWQPACLMAVCLSHASLLVSWQPSAHLSHDSLPVLWQPACLMAACLSYDSLPVITLHAFPASLPVLWQPACPTTACLSYDSLPVLWLYVFTLHAFPAFSSCVYLPAAICQYICLIDASLPHDSSQPAFLLAASLPLEHRIAFSKKTVWCPLQNYRSLAHAYFCGECTNLNFAYT